jgi:hypothetical protein
MNRNKSADLENKQCETTKLFDKKISRELRKRERRNLETKHEIRQQETYMSTRQKLLPLRGEYGYNIQNYTIVLKLLPILSVNKT